MTLVPPRSRFRIYGGAGQYFSAARDVLTGRMTSGSAIGTFEARVAEFLGSAHALAMPQARVGIHLTIKALIKPGQDVVLSPYTIYDVVNMVIAAGGRPLFADIDRETCNINAEEVSKLIGPNTGAVMVTHLHGCACDIEPIAEICRRARVPLIEDASQSLGAKVGGKRLGTFGRAGIFSFGMAKNVNAFYGGVVVTDDAQLRARLAADIGAFPYQSFDLLMKRLALCVVGDVLTLRPIFDAFTFWVYRYGHLHGIEAITNRWRGEDDPVLRPKIREQSLRRMTHMQARLILRALDQVDADAAVRVGLARMYHEGLRGIPEILLPPMREDGSHIYLSFPIQVPDRHGLLRTLVQQCRDLTLQHIGNCADYACFAEYHRECPNARATADQVLLLPTYPGYGATEVERNIRLIRRYFDAG
jgi:dTDP-4-amino-4,6-dideoxygalactose transaminase